MLSRSHGPTTPRVSKERKVCSGIPNVLAAVLIVCIKLIRWSMLNR
jgi:hypothetical protein